MKKRMKKIAMIMFSGGCGVALFASPAQAYLDPGSGSMFLQLLLGGVAGVTVVLKLYWRRLLHFFGRKQEEETDLAAPPTQSVAEANVHGEQRQ